MWLWSSWLFSTCVSPSALLCWASRLWSTERQKRCKSGPAAFRKIKQRRNNTIAVVGMLLATFLVYNSILFSVQTGWQRWWRPALDEGSTPDQSCCLKPTQLTRRSTSHWNTLHLLGESNLNWLILHMHFFFPVLFLCLCSTHLLLKWFLKKASSNKRHDSRAAGLVSVMKLFPTRWCPFP